MVTTLENKRVGYIDKSEAAQLAIEMDNENKELAVKGFKLTPLARIVDCLDIHKLRVKIVVMNNVRRHNEQLAAVVAPSPTDSNKYCLFPTIQDVFSCSKRSQLCTKQNQKNGATSNCPRWKKK